MRLERDEKIPGLAVLASEVAITVRWQYDGNTVAARGNSLLLVWCVVNAEKSDRRALETVRRSCLQVRILPRSHDPRVF